MLYADTSALVRAYLADEPEHAEFELLLLGGRQPVITSELSRLELASAAAAAVRAHCLPEASPLLARFDAACTDGPLTLLELDPTRILPYARRLVLDHHLYSLDAIHLAVALEDGRALAGDDEFVFVTCDTDQAASAATLGLDVA